MRRMVSNEQRSPSWVNSTPSMSFDTILRIYGIKDPALDHLAEIVRGADTSRHDLTPQCGGLFAISLGLSANFPDDHEMLGHGMVMYDALYAWCRNLQAETHNWPAKREGGAAWLNRDRRGRSIAPRHGVSLREAFRVWLRVAVLSFGGPAGQIAVMHRILVEEKRWISESRFLHALNYCMLLPGPEAQQLATYIGWLMHRTLGGIMAGGLFVLPGIIAIMALSYIYAGYGNVPVIVGAVLRPQGRRAGDRDRGGGPDRQALAQEQRDARRSRRPPSSASSFSTCRSRSSFLARR